MTRSLLLERVVPVPAHHRNVARFFKQIKRHSNDRNSSCDSIEVLINKINNAREYHNVPDTITFGYNSLEQRGIPVKDVVFLVNTANFLAANRLGVSPKPITFTGFAQTPVSNKFFTELKNNGFQGGMVSVVNHTEEEVLDTFSEWCKDSSRWHPDILPIDNAIVVTEPKLIQIELTFRQQQILHLIRNRGLTNAKIANELGISEQAVKQHTSLILKKYGVQSRTQLVLAAGAGMRA